MADVALLIKLASADTFCHVGFMSRRHPELVHAIALSKAGRNAEAILIINQLALQHDPSALATLAEMKWRGGMVPQDVRQARDLFRRAGEHGHEAADIIYTNLLANGVGGGRDWPLALKRLAREARKNGLRRLVLATVNNMKLTPEGDSVSICSEQLICESPQVKRFQRLFTAAECDFLKQVAEPHYQPSFVNDSSGQRVRDTIRTSEGATLHWLVEDPAVHALNRRLAMASGTSFEQGEATQILRYRKGQEYRPHFDFVRASENQRILTALVYLNEGYDGGETSFVRAGIAVKGRKGDAIVFRNADDLRRLDPMSEHAGLPIISGTKLLASRWIHESRWCPE